MPSLVGAKEKLGGDFSSVATSFYQHKFYNPYSTTCTGTACTVQLFQCDSNGNPITPVNNVQTGGTLAVGGGRTGDDDSSKTPRTTEML